MNARFVFVALFLSIAASASFAAEPHYQRTKDGKAKVWNNHPLPGDAASWSGARDADGYATGHGTLTWFTTQQQVLTGSNIPMSKHIAASRYTGDMVKGKFTGLVVNVDPNGRTFHGTFVDGHKGKDWTRGPAPAGARSNESAEIAAASKPNEMTQAEIGTEQAEDVRPQPGADSRPIEPPPPAEGPAQSHASINAPHSSPNEKASIEPTAEAPTEYDESLQSLVGPPAGLRVNAMASATPQPSIPPKTAAVAPSVAPARLTAAQIEEITNSEARAHGYNVGDFQHPQAKYDIATESWTVLYDRKSFDGNGMAAVGQRFTVTVDDKTKKTTFAAEK